jgi:hypothetical protein
VRGVCAYLRQQKSQLCKGLQMTETEEISTDVSELLEQLLASRYKNSIISTVSYEVNLA